MLVIGNHGSLVVFADGGPCRSVHRCTDTPTVERRPDYTRFEVDARTFEFNFVVIRNVTAIVVLRIVFVKFSPLD